MNSTTAVDQDLVGVGAVAFISATLRAWETLISHTGAGAPASIAAPEKSTVTFCPVIVSGASACSVGLTTVMWAEPEVATSELSRSGNAHYW